MFFSLVDNVVVPAYVTSQRNKSFHVNLLLCNQHYYLVKSMSRLLLGFYHRKHRRKQYYCHFRLCTFPSIEKLQGHLEVCKREGQRFEMPESHSFLQFKEDQKCVPLPFVLYCKSTRTYSFGSKHFEKNQARPCKFLCNMNLHA